MQGTETQPTAERDSPRRSRARALRVPGSIDLTWVLCPLCGSDVARPIAVGEFFAHPECREIFRAVRCERCTLVYLNPRPSRPLPGDDPRNLTAAHARAIRASVEGLGRCARVLLVGLGDGSLARLLREIGRDDWVLVAIDGDPEAPLRARASSVDLHPGSIASPPSTALTARGYDRIFLDRSLERLERPVADLEILARALRPDGRLVTSTVNLDTPGFRWFGGRHWGGYLFPTHLQLFDLATLETLAKVVGLTVLHRSTIPEPEISARSVRNLLEDFEAAPGLLRALRPLTSSSSALLRCFDAVQASLGHGSLLHAVMGRTA